MKKEYKKLSHFKFDKMELEKGINLLGINSFQDYCKYSVIGPVRNYLRTQTIKALGEKYE